MTTKSLLSDDVKICIHASIEKDECFAEVCGNTTDIALVLGYAIRKYPNLAQAIRLAQAITEWA